MFLGLKDHCETNLAIKVLCTYTHFMYLTIYLFSDTIAFNRWENVLSTMMKAPLSWKETEFVVCTGEFITDFKMRPNFYRQMRQGL